MTVARVARLPLTTTRVLSTTLTVTLRLRTSLLPPLASIVRVPPAPTAVTFPVAAKGVLTRFLALVGFGVAFCAAAGLPPAWARATVADETAGTRSPAASRAATAVRRRRIGGFSFFGDDPSLWSPGSTAATRTVASWLQAQVAASRAEGHPDARAGALGATPGVVSGPPAGQGGQCRVDG